MLLCRLKMGFRFALLLAGGLWAVSSPAQQYHGLNGSPFAGAVSAQLNPASPVNSWVRWQLVPLSMQATVTTNAFYLENFKPTQPQNSLLYLTQTDRKRFADLNTDLNLFHTLVRLPRKSALVLGLSSRTFGHLHSSAFRINNNIADLNEFLALNRQTPRYDIRGQNSLFLELSTTYSKVLKENEYSRLSWGATLHLAKNLIGGNLSMDRVSVLEDTQNRLDTGYLFSGGKLSYNYSNSLDWRAANTTTQENIKDFWRNSPFSLGLSMGVEWLIFDRQERHNPYAQRTYQWKLGASILDLGSSTYKTGNSTGAWVNNSTTPISDSAIRSMINNIGALSDLRDSLTSVFDTLIVLPAKFKVSRPTRLVLQADRHLVGNFFVNAQLSVPFFRTDHPEKWRTRNTSFLTVTPRWETARWGLYLPVQWNSRQQFWVGLAAKLGPLVLGWHNLGFLIKKNPEVQAGGYVLLQFQPFRKQKNHLKDSNWDCW